MKPSAVMAPVIMSTPRPVINLAGGFNQIRRRHDSRRRCVAAGGMAAVMASSEK